ncbi:MAG: arylesterase [Desulfobacterales bacterium]|nr:arylesterase [Desulfobacterales bacterium]
MKIKIGVGIGITLGIIYYLFFSSSYEIKNAIPTGKNIICFGDSLTYGTGASKDMDYPSQLSRRIHMPIINAGVPGDTTETASRRIEDVLTQDPRIVLITLGGNDLKNGVSRDAAFTNLKFIVEKIQDKGALVILGGIDFPLFGRGFGDGYQVLAQQTGSVLIPNIFKGIFNKSGLMSDPIHPNDAGYAIMTEHFYKAIQPYL